MRRGAPTRHCGGCCASSTWPPGAGAATRCSPWRPGGPWKARWLSGPVWWRACCCSPGGSTRRRASWRRRTGLLGTPRTSRCGGLAVPADRWQRRDERWPGLLLCDLLTQVNSVDWPRGDDADLDAFHTALPAGSFPTSPGDDLLLSSLLLDVLARLPAGSEQRRQWLDDGRAHVEARVDAVVGGKHRSSYRRVAQLAAACAEAIALTAGVPAGHAYMTTGSPTESARRVGVGTRGDGDNLEQRDHILMNPSATPACRWASSRLARPSESPGPNSGTAAREATARCIASSDRSGRSSAPDRTSRRTCCADRTASSHASRDSPGRPERRGTRRSRGG